MNGYNIALLRLILCLNMLPESERVCPGICNLNPGECWIWSSTEVEGQKENKAWLYSLQSGTIQETPKNQEHEFRPIITIHNP